VTPIRKRAYILPGNEEFRLQHRCPVNVVPLTKSRCSLGPMVSGRRLLAAVHTMLRRELRAITRWLCLHRAATLQFFFHAPRHPLAKRLWAYNRSQGTAINAVNDLKAVPRRSVANASRMESASSIPIRCNRGSRSAAKPYMAGYLNEPSLPPKLSSTGWL